MCGRTPASEATIVFVHHFSLFGMVLLISGPYCFVVFCHRPFLFGASRTNGYIIIIIIIIIMLVIAFMQGIYIYIPETNRVSRVYSVAAVLYLQFVLHVMLFCQ
jgi:hypothetical protein